MKRATIATVFLACLATLASAHESPVDHVHRMLRMESERRPAGPGAASEDVLIVTYRVVLTERAALLQLKAMDADGNGVISDAERQAFFVQRGQEIASQLQVAVDGAAVPVKAAGEVTLDPVFGQTFRFEARVPTLTAGGHKGRLVDGYSQRLPGPYVWLPPAPAAATAPRLSPIQLKMSPPATDKESGRAPGAISLDFELAVP